MLNKQLLLSMLIAMSTLIHTNDIELFYFQTSLNSYQELPLKDIKKHIAAHARIRLTKNWIFTSEYIHNGTMSAINFYEELPATPENKATMQEILISHGNYIYSILHWSKRKHIALIDGFMNEVVGKRLERTMFDMLPDTVYPLILAMQSIK